ncbi:hypothetical protein NEOKW01_0116 [Nematocida sp. AWRm80]|nr:hypothetical protein NEOKW01_0116 [Nematocida sp. AWRm80]
MFKEIYKESIKMDIIESIPTGDRNERIFPNINEVDRVIPDCYKNSSRKNKEDKLEKFSEGTLFYVFFTHCGERVQLEAYERLLKLGWSYSKEMKTFVQIIKRVPNASLILYFDNCTWKKVTKEINIDQAFLSTLENYTQ